MAALVAKVLFPKITLSLSYLLRLSTRPLIQVRTLVHASLEKQNSSNLGNTLKGTRMKTEKIDIHKTSLLCLRPDSWSQRRDDTIYAVSHTVEVC